MTVNCFSTGLRTGLAFVFLLALAACASKSPAPVFERGSATAALPPGSTHTVKSGDTLHSIAREYGIDFRELIALNHIENPNQISAGRVLLIKPRAKLEEAPAGGATTAPISSETVVARPIGDAGVQAVAHPANTDKLKREPKAGKLPYSEQAFAEAQGSKPAAAAEAAGAKAPEEAKAVEKPAAVEGIAWIWPAKGKMVGTFSDTGNKGVDVAGKAGEPILAAADGKVIYADEGLRGYGKLVIIKHDSVYVSAYAHNQSIQVKEGQAVKQGQKIAEMGNSDATQVKLHFEIRRDAKPVDPLKYLPAR